MRVSAKIVARAVYRGEERIVSDKSTTFPVAYFLRDAFQEFECHWPIALFCIGCNLRCVECHNSEIVYTEACSALNWRSCLEENLSSANDSVVLCGGEPTIWGEGFINVLRWVRERNLLTKVFSNGQAPSTLERAAKFISAASIDLKAVRGVSEVVGFDDISDEEYLGRLEDSVEILRRANVDVEIRTTAWDCVKEQLPDISEFARKKFPGTRHIVQRKHLPAV